MARPSFREMGFYVSVEPGTDDLVVGNPQLGLSDVESYDLRAEYTFGETGGPRRPQPVLQDHPGSDREHRDPQSAQLRQQLDRPLPHLLQQPERGHRSRASRSRRARTWASSASTSSEYFSIGGNYTYIDAEVDRTEAELARSVPFFGVAEGDRQRFTGLEKSRRLFGQPEWIANADISFDHPDWGTKVTLAWFGDQQHPGCRRQRVHRAERHHRGLHPRPLHRQLRPARPDREPADLARPDRKSQRQEPHGQRAAGHLRPGADPQGLRRALLQGRPATTRSRSPRRSSSDAARALRSHGRRVAFP